MPAEFSILITPLEDASRPVVEAKQFPLLVRHLLDRFFNNELVSVEGETLPLIMTVAWAMALPTLVATILLFPAYHRFYPRPPVPPFWGQVADRYFFVMYEWVVMGGITVFEWDLLFPNALDVFVLSVLPIAHRRLLLARVAAVTTFLGCFLLGTSSLGTFFFPLATEPANAARAYAAHSVAVLAAGVCAASLVLALQGVLISVFGARIFRMVATFLQSLLIMTASIVLFLFPVVSHSLEPLVQSSALAARCFPPFWFLGIYQSILSGPATLPAFTRLARIGYEATGILLALAVITYPIAYRRSVREAIEGFLAPQRRRWLVRPLLAALHRSVLRTPAQRAIYHFVNQTLFRSQRHRLYLAMYAGLGIALAFSWIMVFHDSGGQLSIGISSSGVRMAIPALAFWVVAGLCTSLLSPADAKGGWIFPLIGGRVTLDQLRTVQRWVLVWSVSLLVAAVIGLTWLSSPDLHQVHFLSVQLLVGIGICFILSDLFTLQTKTIPFTEPRVPRNTDLAFILLRYIVLFPALVVYTVQCEPWIESSFLRLVAAALAIVAAHLGLRATQSRMFRTREAAPNMEDEGEQSRVLGLRS